jgi:hypothetical protein
MLCMLLLSYEWTLPNDLWDWASVTGNQLLWDIWNSCLILCFKKRPRSSFISIIFFFQNVGMQVLILWHSFVRCAILRGTTGHVYLTQCHLTTLCHITCVQNFICSLCAAHVISRLKAVPLIARLWYLRRCDRKRVPQSAVRKGPSTLEMWKFDMEMQPANRGSSL